MTLDTGGAWILFVVGVAVFDGLLWLTGHRTLSQQCWSAVKRHPVPVSLFTGLAVGFVLGHLFW